MRQRLETCKIGRAETLKAAGTRKDCQISTICFLSELACFTQKIHPAFDRTIHRGRSVASTHAGVQLAGHGRWLVAANSQGMGMGTNALPKFSMFFLYSSHVGGLIISTHIHGGMCGCLVGLYFRHCVGMLGCWGVLGIPFEKHPGCGCVQVVSGISIRICLSQSSPRHQELGNIAWCYGTLQLHDPTALASVGGLGMLLNHVKPI